MLITIDLWGTLIKASPSFKVEKTKLIQKYFDRPDEEILSKTSKIKANLNNVIEKTGWQPTEDILYDYLFSEMQEGYKNVKFDKKQFIKDYQDLAIKVSPTLYSTQTLPNLAKLSTVGTLVLSSNTVFLNGETLSEILKKLNIHVFFNKLLFSDQMQVSKPKKEMFYNSDYHIGDNYYTDYLGALNAKSKPLLINSNNKTLENAYNNILLSTK